ncbi:MAG: indolepyruvate oxidoreductase subunit beta [Brevinematales bacterium]|nr:indolepyruvate oxidoreductase subunit beta [Brevinematales bacterium]
MESKSVVLCGVGGQGIILASEIISEALFRHGYDVKKNEIHGMSQRGGSVLSFIRFGDKVYSPVVKLGEADIVMSFEELEMLRNVHFLKKDGHAVTTDIKIDPVPVILGTAEYPQDIPAMLKKYTKNLCILDIENALREIGNVKAINVLVIGYLSHLLPEVKELTWKDAISGMVKPEFREMNLKAFDFGKQLACEFNPQ